MKYTDLNTTQQWMTVKTKQPSTCPECALGWLEEISLRNELWLRCMSCGWMQKLTKKIVKPMRGVDENS